ncbi:MAG: helix-turn-helix domain-containing protein [Bacteroidota bacterium]
MNLLTVLVSTAAVQGIISGILFIVLQKNHSLQNKLLSFLIILLSMALINLVLMDSGIRYQSVVLNLMAYIVPWLLPMAIGPVLYFYVTSGIDHQFQLSRHRRHLYPIVVDLLPYAAGIVLVLGLITHLITNESQWRFVIDEYNVYTDVIRWISLTTYVMLSSRRLKDAVSDEDVNWFRNVIIAFSVFQAIWLLHLLPYLSPSFRNQFLDLITWYPIYIPLAILVYWLSVNGYIRMSRPVAKKTLLMPVDAAGSTFRVLVSAMEDDRLFLDPEMSVAKLSDHVKVSQKTISAVLNQHRGISFNQFVNSYRVEELKRRLKSPEHRNLTISGLGLECGFNSSATMQRAFRQLAKCSPREYQLKTIQKLSQIQI